MAVEVRYFAEVVAGIEDLATAELAELGAVDCTPGDGGVRLRHPRSSELLGAGMVSALYRELRFDVSRPKALLGDAAARRLAAAVGEVAGGMRTFRLAAAGAESTVFRRLAAGLESATGLREDGADGDMLIRVRPYREGDAGGWEVLLRLTPRPLSTRAWRTCNRPGGLNATVAVALNELLDGIGRGSYLNLMCGSGTLLVERALAAPYRRLVGVDLEPSALTCAAENLASAGVGQDAELVAADVRSPDLVERLLRGQGERFDAIAADAPWGDAVGSHRGNEELHETLFQVSARLIAPRGRFGIVTHEVRLLRRVLERQPGWRVVSRRQVEHGGHNPVMLVLERVDDAVTRS